MTNTETLVDNISEKLNGYNLKTRIKYMLTHLIATIITLGCLLISLHYQKIGMIIFNIIMTIFNTYFFCRHYTKLINSIEELTSSSTVSLEKT